MLNGLRISTLLLIAFAAGFVTRSALHDNVARSTEAPPPADAGWHHRCGDMDGMKYLFHDIERVATAPDTSSQSLWTPADLPWQRDREAVRTAIEREAERCWFNPESDETRDRCRRGVIRAFYRGQVAQAGIAALRERGPISLNPMWQRWREGDSERTLSEDLTALLRERNECDEEPSPTFHLFLSVIR